MGDSPSSLGGTKEIAIAVKESSSILSMNAEVLTFVFSFPSADNVMIL